EDLRKRLEIVQDEDDDLFVEATLLAQKVPVVDYQIVMIDNKPRYKIIKADVTLQLYISFTILLKNFDREDLETLWRIVRDRFSTSKPANFSDEYLLLTLKTMFKELDGQDAIWRNQKSVHGLALVKRWKLLTSYFKLKRKVRCLWSYSGLQDCNSKNINKELMLPSESKDCQSKVDAASLRLKLFKDVAAADAKAKDPFSKGPPQLPSCSAVTPNEPVDPVSMGDEHLNTIPKMESDEFIKSSVENLVPNPSESEGKNGCDLPACFTTFLNVLFDANCEFDSSDDQSLSDEDVPDKIFSNPLFEEEIIPMKIDQHLFNAESDLIESMLNRDSSIISSSSKIDSLLDEFSGELTLLKSIPSGIDKIGCHPENEIRLIERL
nr:hypothetical protein [Tanacetum cinerariifolium]